ncbi:MOSC domain-containing protein [Aquirufa rosea]|uniref:MOSC domain-containing protein n=1 Tax=Aquirufa rosea TaxID=2509241 RepID=A0A4Q1C0E1_9BACT|nr:MOSC N-terminal beta barrel domain-containing protein [Aquirufa rosea]RXK49892.1 MOSC domain-containing protein [Aquirufa rosea]
MATLEIAHLYIYPIKSLGALALQEAQVEKQGLAGDRRYMLVDSNGKFITQRTKPELTRFQLKAKEAGFVVLDTITGHEKSLMNNVALGELISVQIWDDHLMARKVEDGWSAWFSELLQEIVFLVRLTEESPRIIPEKFQTTLVKESSFADALPVLFCSEASYEALENHMGKEVDRLRFRPNIIVKGSKAFEEDTWKQISLGSVLLSGAKPCARCQLITVNPQTGQISKEVMAKLAELRTFGNKVYFGQQFVPEHLGKLRLGDQITVQVRQYAKY